MTLRHLPLLAACLLLRALAEVFSTLHILAYLAYAGLDGVSLWLMGRAK